MFFLIMFFLSFFIFLFFLQLKQLFNYILIVKKRRYILFLKFKYDNPIFNPSIQPVSVTVNIGIITYYPEFDKITDDLKNKKYIINSRNLFKI